MFVPSLTGLGLSLALPGTAVPGYRLFRPFGTGLIGYGEFTPVAGTYQSSALRQPTGIADPWKRCFLEERTRMLGEDGPRSTKQSRRDGTTCSPARQCRVGSG
jgi:hypothetical protein